jgi:hypothetical protein
MEGLFLVVGQIQRLSLDQQIDYFRNTKVELVQVLGSEKAVEDLVNGAIFSMTIGANDYINNYVSPLKDTADIFLPSHEFSVKVLTQYKAQLMVQSLSPFRPSLLYFHSRDEKTGGCGM